MIAELRTLEAMHQAHGVAAARTCADCRFCVSRPQSHPTRGTVQRVICLKSDARLSSRGEQRRAEWRRRNQACGLFEEAERG